MVSFHRTRDRPLVAQLQVDETTEKKVRKTFPKPAEKPKIFIVTDKLLTGYDAPVLYCMYLDKPMRDHVLLQAVARVNRPYEDEKGIKKPCGLIIDFVGVLKELNKALAFDSDKVSGVIEDLDLLLTRFKQLVTGPGRHYLDLAGGTGGNDEKLEKLLYQTFLDKEERQKFAEFYKELETLYEILSPSPELRDHIEDFNRLADIYVMLRNAYGTKTTFLGDLAHKTKMLVRQNATAHGLDKMTKTVEFYEAALQMLKEGQAPDAGKVINLARSLVEFGTREGEHDPMLMGIAERAEAILEAFTERQTSTLQALDRLKELMEEKRTLEDERKHWRGDASGFPIFWTLRRANLPSPETVAGEIAAAFKRFPNYQTSADELRQLKAEIYKALLRVVSGKRMVDLAEEILKSVRP